MSVGIQELADQAYRATKIVAQVRERMLPPNSTKSPPLITSDRLLQLCDLTKEQLKYRIGKGDLPSGTVRSSGSRREFTVRDARSWTKALRAKYLRPTGARAVAIAVGNFKGGVGKTSTTMILAQGLSLAGHRVLAIDLDPQGSLTTLFGLMPVTEIEEEDTVAPLCHGDQTDIRYAIRSTYWDGIDLVPASPTLFSAEFALPARQAKDSNFSFWDVLRRGLETVRDDYDVILIDTSPALSYLTINAFFASEGLIVPLPPSALDFASSAQFWTLFSDLAGGIGRQRGIEKRFDFISVLLTRVDMTDVATGVVREWISAAYGAKVLPVEIPSTRVASTTSTEFGTVYDVSKYEGSKRTYERAKVAYDRLVELVEQAVIQSWNEQLSK